MTDSIGMTLIHLSSGEFFMGSIETPEELSRKYGARIYAYEGEQPCQLIMLTEGFWMGQTEVTQGQFRRFIDETGYRTRAERCGVGGGIDKQGWRWIEGSRWDNPGIPQTDSHPVVQVCWEDAVAFCRWLSEKERREYDLLTEAQWESACRAGTDTAYSWGDDLAQGKHYANMVDDAAHRWIMQFGRTIDDRCPFDDGFATTAPVASFRPNLWGFYDMHGNVAEWCRDWYDKEYCARSRGFDPRAPSPGRTARCAAARGFATAASVPPRPATVSRPCSAVSPAASALFSGDLPTELASACLFLEPGSSLAGGGAAATVRLSPAMSAAWVFCVEAWQTLS
jgi:formylglycine-generating enzyme required for sulfatase activity